LSILGPLQQSVGQPLVADFSFPTTNGPYAIVLDAGSPVAFNATASGGTQAYSYGWEFGDTGSATGNYPSHTFLAAGSYTVVLTVTDFAGVKATASHALVIDSSPYRIDFSSPTITAGSPTAFNGTGGFGVYYWDFGDGSASQNTCCALFTHTYPKAANYTVVYTPFDGSGTATSASHVVNVIPTHLTADFSSPIITEGSPVTLNATTSGGTGPYQFSWSFSDHSTGAGGFPTHTFASAGNPVAFLTVTDANQGQAVASRVLSVRSSPYRIDFSYPDTSAGSPVTFNGTIAGFYYQSWLFGDGGSTGYYCCSPVTHTFAVPGNYTVVYTPNDGSGVSATASHVVNVRQTRVLVDFTHPEATPGSPVSFNATSSGGVPPYTFSWKFNTTLSATGRYPDHTFADAGFAIVILSVIDGIGETATASNAVQIMSSPYRIDFSFTGPSAGSPVTFNGTIAGFYYQSWLFGDGGSTGYYCCSPVTHTYARSGAYTVVYKPNDGSGVSATASHVLVIPGPPASPTSTSVACLPLSVTIGSTATCSATVTDTSSSPTNPAGAVTFSNSGGSGNFGGTTCSLVSSGLNAATCTISYVPSAVGSGSQSVTASYGGDDTHQPSVSSAFTLTVNKASPSIATTLFATGIAVGGSVSDSAKLTGGFSAGGTVTYQFFSGSSCSAAPTIVGPPVSVTNGTVPSSAPQTFAAAGSFSWSAIYSGDGNNNGVTSACEQLTVNPAADFSLTPTSTTISVTANSLGSDKLRVDAIYGFTGTVSFLRVGSPFGGVSYDCSSVTLSSTTTSANSTCTFSSNTPGTYTAVVNGTGGTPSVSHQVTYTVIVVKNNPSIHTTLSASTITVGGSVTDSATLTGTDTLTASGTVTYEFFTGSSCAGTATVVGSPVVVSSGVIPNSASQTFSSAGLFSWNAVYNGDTNNNGVTSLCEPLSVNPLTGVAVTTKLSATTIIVGGSVSDSATLSGVTPAAGGTVIYRMSNTGDCSSPVIVVATVDVANGVVPSSPSKIFSSPGLFGWNAAYSGDANNGGASSICEPLTVNKASPTLSTTLSASTITVGGSVSDTATLAGGFTPTGSVSFSFYSGDCSSGIVTIILPSVGLTGSSATSTPEAFNTVGSFSWKAVYLGDSNNNVATSSCETLSVVTSAGFTISASPTSLTVAPEDSSSCEGQGSAQRCDDEASSTISVTGLNGFSGTVTLTVSTSPGLTVSLSTLRIVGSGSSILTVSDGRPGNYTVTVTGTSGSIIRSVVVKVMVRPPVPLKCGGDSDCNIESDAPLSDVRFGDKKIHFTVDGTAGARGAVNVTIPRSAVPDIDRIEVSVDGAKQPRSSLMIAVDDSNYHVYFSFTFHSPVTIDIDLSPAVTILGLNPLTFYGIVGVGIAIVVAAGVVTLLRRRGAEEQSARTP